LEPDRFRQGRDPLITSFIVKVIVVSGSRQSNFSIARK
jgi:hypothetical protein